MTASVLGRDSSFVVVVGVVACAALVSGGLVPLVRALAYRLGVLDRPKQGKMHTGATPYLGGVAIGLTTIVLTLIVARPDSDALWLLGGGVLMCATGLIDDLRNLPPGPRLAVETLAALMAVEGGARLVLFDNWVDVLLSVGWLVVISNSFNLLDNMDGVAGSVATAASLTMMVAALGLEQWFIAGLMASLAGACLGFLWFNWHPASIFMGDAGSLLLGYLLAAGAIVLAGAVSVGGVTEAVAAVLVMAVAVFDTSLVVVSRTRAGRSIMVGGTDHTTHRLHGLGMPIRGVAAAFAVAACGTTVAGMLVLRDRLTPWVFPALLAVAVPPYLWLQRIPVYERGAGRTT